jgi:hypothetical protein
MEETPMNYAMKFGNAARTRVKARSKPLIYFAGKIGQNDWRHSLVCADLRGAIGSGGNDEGLFDPGFTLDCGRYLYCGPFFVSCDHGCAHGANQHGAIGGCCDDDYHEVTEFDEPGFNDLIARRRAIDAKHNRVFNINLRRLRSANFVFAYIESGDAFGTLIELGMAHSWRIPIGLRLPPEASDDMWMVARTAQRVYRGSPGECWKEFCRDFLSPAEHAA